ncbi:hypothetical protein [Streptomyces sp. NPDC003015]
MLFVLVNSNLALILVRLWRTPPTALVALDPRRQQALLARASPDAALSEIDLNAQISPGPTRRKPSGSVYGGAGRRKTSPDDITGPMLRSSSRSVRPYCRTGLQTRPLVRAASR